ncbi:MAG: hypothetical protein LBS62_12990 [Clostridiales bacterium]|jgi:glycerol kinase|nr:hypothetical protein [Clostridiales bacterium]
MKDYILVLDSGTTGVKSLLYDRDLNLVSIAVRNVKSYYPGDRMVEQDPEEIYRLVVETAKEALAQKNAAPEDVACAAITTQRTSWLFWDGVTRRPLCNLITWQDTRGVDYLQKHFVENETFNTYFPGVAPYLPSIYVPVAVVANKEIIPGFTEALAGENVKWGNVDTWLLYRLTGGKVYATSASAASNSTMLDNPSGQWSKYIAQFVGMREDMFPEVRDENAGYGNISADVFGAEIPVCCMIADQQAAMFAQGCFSPTVAKCTSGSGTFVNVNIGSEYKTYGNFFTTIAWQLDGKITYMFEGNSYTAGSCLEWAQKQLELYKDVERLNEDAASVPDSNGVYFVPALGGMSGAPYLDPTARASFMGIGPGANRRHFARAVLESVAYAAVGVIQTFKDLGVDIRKLSVSGGVSSSDLSVQIMSNILDMDIERSESVEATGYGAAALSAVTLGWRTFEDCAAGMPAKDVFKPAPDSGKDKEHFAMWKKAVERSLRWLE